MSDPRPRIVLALSPLGEQTLEPLLFDAKDAPLQLLATTLEADELLARVEEQPPDAVLLSPEFSGLTTGHCERLRSTGAHLIGLALGEHERTALTALGVETQIDPTISRQELLAAIAGPNTGQDAEQPTLSPAPADRPKRDEDHGTLLAIVGSKGAPGASECAASLAALAASRWETLLVELDALGGGLSLRLGADPADGSVLGLIRAIENREAGLGELVERWRCEREGWAPVLLGPPDPNALSDLAAPGAVTCALDALTEVYPLVVCDVGFQITDAGSAAARVHREALINADMVLLVLGCSEAQLRDGLRQLDVLQQTLAIAPERLRIIAAGVGAPSSMPKETVSATLAERLADTGLTVDAWLAWDGRGARRARREGLPIALARRRSAYARSLSTLLDELFLSDAQAPRAKRRKLRLSVPKPTRQTTTAAYQEDEEVALPWQT